MRDDYQHQGLGTLLGNNLIRIARQEKIKLIKAEILADNYPMQNLCSKLGFELHKGNDVVMAIYQCNT